MQDDQSIHRGRRQFLGQGVATLAGLAAGSAALGAAAGATPARAGDADDAGAWPRYEGKVVLITGATSGIGEAAAHAFARKGASVFFCGRRQDRGEGVEAAIRAAGGEATYMQADVREPEQVKAFVDACVDTYGAIDIAFNNAGIEGPMGELHEIAMTGEGSYADVMRTNVDGVLCAMACEIPVMRAQGSGIIVNTGSLLSHRGSPTGGAYAASKHAVIGLTRSAAAAEAPHGVRVLSLSPGGTMTELAQRMAGGAPEAWAANHPMGRIAEPEDIANALVNLTAMEATFLTGTDVRVDGGQMA